MAKKIVLSDVFKKHLRIVCYLLVSGMLGCSLSILAGKPGLVAIFAPAINYILYALEKEIKNEGVIKAIKG